MGLPSLLVRGFLWAFVWVSPAHADALGEFTCARFTGPVPCEIDTSGYRDLDPRTGLSPNDLTGSVHLVSSPADIRRLRELQPGDQVVLQDGVWTDALIDVRAEGTFDQPILIRSENPDGVVLSGRSSISLMGSNLILEGLRIENGTATSESYVALLVGRSNDPGRRCDYCIVRDVEIDGYNPADLHPLGAPPLRYTMVRVRGLDVTVINSAFRNMRGWGHMLNAENPRDGPMRLHLLDSTFSDRPIYVPNPIFLDDESVPVSLRSQVRLNGREVIVIRASLDHPSSFSIIAGNRIERADGENEMISLKASDIAVLDNDFIDNNGTVTLRGAQRVLVSGNLFQGASPDRRGEFTGTGIRILGEGHVVVGNTFRGIHPTRNYRSYYPLTLSFGNGQGLSAGHSQVHDVIIADNLIEDSTYAVGIGVGHQLSSHPFYPDNVLFTGNRYRDIQSEEIFSINVRGTPQDIEEVRSSIFAGIMIEDPGISN
jgi:poly(beta-D-mannuronate) lyase